MFLKGISEESFRWHIAFGRPTVASAVVILSNSEESFSGGILLFGRPMVAPTVVILSNSEESYIQIFKILHFVQDDIIYYTY